MDKESKLVDIVIRALPDRIKEDIESQNYSIYEYDCSEENESTKDSVISSEILPKAPIVFSSMAPEDIDDLARDLERMVKSAEKYAILLFPFDEYSISLFPEVIDDQYQISFFKIIHCDSGESCQAGDQILLVYQKKSADSCLKMSEIYDNQIKRMLRDDQGNRRIIDEISTSLIEYEQIVKQITEDDDRLRNRVEWVSKSAPYKFAHGAVEMKHIIFGTKDEKQRGMRWLLKDKSIDTGFNYFRDICNQEQEINNDLNNLNKNLESDSVKQYIIDFIFNHRDADFFYIYPSTIDWNVPLFQRPQQMAMALSQMNIPVFYLTWNIFDKIEKTTLIDENILLVKAEDIDEVKKRINIISDVLKAYNKEYVLDLYSTGVCYDLSFIDAVKSDNGKILYEYIDVITGEIGGIEIPEGFKEMHRTFCQDDNVYIIATADKLYDEVLSLRKTEKNTLCSGNGVDVNHFQSTNSEGVPDNLKHIVTSGKPVIGYFGALANWFDYDLVVEAAKARPDYYFLLIGPEYGDVTSKINKLKKYSNIIVPGGLDYNVLPSVAQHFTVATIPFLLNDITEATSPIKLFEYMSMGKPVVSTAMKECFKIPEIKIANNANEFIEALDEAVTIMNGPDRKKYEQKMVAIAEENSWQAKAKELVELVKA